MTIIEFYDKTAIENIASTIICKPAKVIFVGKSGKKIQKSINIYRTIANKKGIDVEFEYVSVPNDLNKIVDALDDIYNSNSDCVFDLEGGDDLFMVAVGIIAERYKDDNVQLHRYNVNNNMLYDCDSDKNKNASLLTEISVKENIELYGGKISDNTEIWNFNSEFQTDIELIWSICNESNSNWNKQIGLLARINSSFDTADEDLEIKYNIITVKNSISDFIPSKLNCLLKQFYKYGLIKELKMENIVSFKFKNSQIKKCLLKSGQILELYITSKLKQLSSENGEKLYNDVQTGVFIDWDGVLYPEDNINVINEIDIIAMKNLIPIFISCKNGDMNIDELYKLSSVSKKFGGKYAKRVIIISEINKLKSVASDFVRARAKEMNITVIEDPGSLTDIELNKKLKKLWK